MVGSHSDRGGGVVGRQVQLALCGHCDQALRVHLKMVEMVIMVVTAMVIRLSMFIIVTKVTVTRLSEFTSALGFTRKFATTVKVFSVSK